MVCPGSVSQSRGIDDAESDHAALGTLAHALGELCLVQSIEPWTKIGETNMSKHTTEDGELLMVDKNMADAVHQYIHFIEQWHPDWQRSQFAWVEKRFHCPSIHRLFYGTVDFAHVTMNSSKTGENILDVWDYKHGVGVVVEADDNPQLKYYAAGVLEELKLWDEIDRIRLHIVQPRGWHWQGPHRVWECTSDELDAWVFDTLVPAMERTEVSRDTKAGDHCRFCPARSRQCPALMDAAIAYTRMILMVEKEGAAELTDEQIGHLMVLHDLAKIQIRAVSKVAHGKLSTGQDIEGLKLVNSRTNRKFKDGAEEAAIEHFGKRKAFTTPELKSPAQLDEMPGGKEFTARWAFKPEGGTTVALASDPRKAIKRNVKSLFKPVKKETADG